MGRVGRRKVSSSSRRSSKNGSPRRGRRLLLASVDFRKEDNDHVVSGATQQQEEEQGKQMSRGQVYRAALVSCVHSERPTWDDNDEDNDDEKERDTDVDTDDDTDDGDDNGTDDDDNVSTTRPKPRSRKERGSRSQRGATGTTYVLSMGSSSTGKTQQGRKLKMMGMSDMSAQFDDDGLFFDDDDATTAATFAGGAMNIPPLQPMRMNMRMRMRMRQRATTAIPLVTTAPALSPTVKPSTIGPTTLKPTPVPSISSQPSLSSAPSTKPSTAAPNAVSQSPSPVVVRVPTRRTRPPFQPMRMRMRMRRPMRPPQPPPVASMMGMMGTSMMGMSGQRGGGGGGGGDFGGRPYVETVQAALAYTFFPGTGMNPTRQEINALVDVTEDFVLDTLDRNGLTGADFRMANLVAQYAPGGNLDRFVLLFNGNAYLPSPYSGFVDSDDIARLIANANYRDYILNYVYEAEPFTQNIFYETNSVDFAGQGVFYDS